MNLFWKNLFGTLESAEKMEQAELDLIAAYKRFTRVAASAELAEYKKLYQEVNSASFQEKKTTWVSRKYRDTEEFQKMRQFKRLDTNQSIKLYYQTLASGELKEFLAFKNSAEYGLPERIKAIAEDPKIKKLMRFEQSKACKTYFRYHNSDEIKEYEKLKTEVVREGFIKVIKDKKRPGYKNTEEYQKMRQFKRLNANRSITLYYETLVSGELKAFLTFKNTDEYKLLVNREAIAKDENRRKFERFEQSKSYKTYLRYHNSNEIKEYETLKAEVENNDFMKRRDFWENPKRWLTTAEYQTEQAYLALANHDDIKFYEKTDEKSFNFLKTWSIAFEDNFEGSSIDAKKWQNGFYHKTPLKRIYSFPNEKQAYTEQNISVANSELCICTKAEQIESAAWDTKYGFITKQFKFTSGIINAGDAFKQNKGLIRAKIAVRGSRSISHAFWMGAEGKLPLTNIFQSVGKKIFAGNYFAEGNMVSKEARSIKGLNARKFHIYSLEWTEKELIWSINNIEVFRTAKGIPNAAMFPAFNSFITEKQKGGNGTFAVDWIRIYKKA